MTKLERDYLDVIYSEQERPLTSYPSKLTRYLFDRYKINKSEKLLDVGCGRGEFLRGFLDCGVDGYGVDKSQVGRRYCPDANIRTADLEREPLPYPDDYFDIVYSKSVIEHFYYPEKFIQEIFRVLKPGGRIITLCPDWEFNYRIYFEDYTHRTPFMKSSLRSIQLINGFDNVNVERFRQLPVLWGSWGWLMLGLAEITRICTPSGLRYKSKWVRFSKELMLLSSSTKPLVSSKASLDE